MPLLEYASLKLLQAWGPFLFKPSRLSLLLILLAAANALWLEKRHHPWTRCASVPAGLGRSEFPMRMHRFEFADGPVLIAQDDLRIRIWDPNGGILLHEIGDGRGMIFAMVPTRSGNQILGFFFKDPPGEMILFDTRSGKPVKQANAITDGIRGGVEVARYAYRAVTPQPIHRIPLHHYQRLDGFSFWDLDGPRYHTRLPHTASFVGSGSAIISPDGRSVAISSPADYVDPFNLEPEYDRVTVLDFATGRIRFEIFNAKAQRFSDDSKFLTLVPLYRKRTRLIDLQETPSPQLAPPPPPPGMIHFSGSFEVMIDAETGVEHSRAKIVPYRKFYQGFANSPDGCRIATLSVTGSAATLYIDSLREPASPPATLPVGGVFSLGGYLPITFSADGRRLFAPGPDADTIGVYDESLRVLAILRRQSFDFSRFAVSSDSRYFATFNASTDNLSFYRQTGLDCPESPLGALAFPHLWLFAILISFAAYSLRRDALKFASEPAFRVLSLVLLITALPRTIHAAAAVCMDETFLTPMPLLLLCAIGLATGARLYRVLTLAVLASTVSIELYCLHRLRMAGPTESTIAQIFDRTYALPNLSLIILLGLGVLMILPALYLLSRRRAFS